MLLLHGFPDSWLLWRHQVGALAAAGHRVLAPDLRGFGQSARPGAVEAYRMRTLVADVTGLLDLAGVRQAALVGHDWGAALAWRVAMYAPDRVERLAVVSVGHPLAGVAVGLPQRQLSWYVLWFLFPPRRPGGRPQLVPGQQRPRPVPGLRPGPVPDAKVACPTLGFWSSDPVLSEAQMTGSADYVTGPWRYERLEGIDHWVPVHAPDQLSQLLVEFLGIT